MASQGITRPLCALAPHRPAHHEQVRISFNSTYHRYASAFFICIVSHAALSTHGRAVRCDIWNAVTVTSPSPVSDAGISAIDRAAHNAETWPAPRVPTLPLSPCPAGFGQGPAGVHGVRSTVRRVRSGPRGPVWIRLSPPGFNWSRIGVPGVRESRCLITSAWILDRFRGSGLLAMPIQICIIMV